MSTHNIGFYEDMTKIIFELSSNSHLISSTALVNIHQESSKSLQLCKLVRVMPGPRPQRQVFSQRDSN